MTTEALATWEGQFIESWCMRWHLPELHMFATVPSTNDVIKARAEEGAPAGACAIAELQTRGRGRRDRRWDAPAGTALLLSMLFRPSSHSAADLAGTIPLRVGMAVARAIEEVTTVAVRLKWPNDILATDGRKIAGVLCESSLASTGVAYTVVGVGINVLQTTEQLHIDGANTATSLCMLTDQAVSRASLAGAIIAELLTLSQRSASALSPDELSEYAQRDSLAMRDVTADGAAVGVADGINAVGELRVRNGAATRSIHAGTIRAI